MTCKELCDFLMMYLDGELSAAERSAFEAHLSACPPCVTYLDTYRKTVDLCRAAHTGNAEAPLPDDLVKAILSSRSAAGS